MIEEIRWPPTSGAISGSLDEAKEKGWRTVFTDRRLTSPNRLAWKYLFDITPDWEAIDIGAGGGGIACQLAEYCRVVALDNDPGNIAFLRLRKEQNKLDNLTVAEEDAVQIGAVSNSFDLAIMVGSLEWIPIGHPDLYPIAQMVALREAYRILKSNGQLFLGIENADYLGYYLGQKEVHTDIKYLSLVGDQLSRDLRGKPYLERTYSRNAYLVMLKNAGFKDIKTYWLYPDYAFTHLVIPLDDPEITKYFIQEHINYDNYSQGLDYHLRVFYNYLENIADHVQFYGFVGRKC